MNWKLQTASLFLTQLISPTLHVVRKYLTFEAMGMLHGVPMLEASTCGNFVPRVKIVDFDMDLFMVQLIE